MLTDVRRLRDFYATPLGAVVRRQVGRRIRSFWPSLTGQRVLGIGYANPYLGRFRGEAERLLTLAPAGMGVEPWPRQGAGLAVLADDRELPFPDMSMDRILLVHALEGTGHTRALLREIWRIMAPGARLLVVAPNRRSVWAHVEGSPLGHGQPYSVGQLSALLKDTMFTPQVSGTALFVPPFRWRLALAGAGAWERIGARWFSALGGVVLVDATKEVYAGTRVQVDDQAKVALVQRPSQPPRGNGRHLRVGSVSDGAVIPVEGCGKIVGDLLDGEGVEGRDFISNGRIVDLDLGRREIGA
ncbi:MAG: class I SAM-dependent methyltransferase [Magnetospiraceae bacterium]